MIHVSVMEFWKNGKRFVKFNNVVYAVPDDFDLIYFLYVNLVGWI